MTEVFWNRLTAAELRARAAENAIVLLPVASTEQHGPQLATGVDTFLATEGCRRIANLVAAKQPIVVAPTVWSGLAEHHVAFGGTFTLSLTTFHALLRDLCQSIVRAGFSRIMIVNGHGGNIAALSALTTDLAQEVNVPVAMTTLYSLAHMTRAYEPVLEDQRGVMHACEAETSMMMAVHPDCVRPDKIAEAFGPTHHAAPGEAGIAIWRSFKDMTPTGVIGDARKATAAKGEQLLDIAARLVADKLIAGEPWA